MSRFTNRLIFAGCLVAGVPLHAQRKSAPLQCAAVADFFDVVDRDTVTRSRVMVNDSSFESTSHDVAQGALARYSGRLTSTGEIRTLHIEVWPHAADSAGPPAQIADISREGSEVVARVASRPAAERLMVKFADVEYTLVLAPDRSILSAATAGKLGVQPSRLSRRDCR